MEYVVVTYPTDRDVRIEEQTTGKTNQTLMVEMGHHTFDLGEPQDYAPNSVEKNVQDTTSITPLVIDDFQPAGGDL